MHKSKIVNMLWIGNELGRIEHLSIASWLAHGHHVRLHCYAPFKGLPADVELVDASTTVPLDRMQQLRHKATGSYALASNYFRYLLQIQGGGLWSDVDVVCLKPVKIDSDVLFGLEEPGRLNNAVLYLGPELALTRDLSELFRANYFPPWTRAHLPRFHGFRSFLGKGLTPADMPWGSYGPKALTELARKHGLMSMAKPVEVFYPLHYSEAVKVFDPAFSLDKIILEQTQTLHLWNEMIREVKHQKPASGTPLAKLCAQFGI